MGNSISYTTTECQVDLETASGSIKGLQYDSKSRRFAGVPYAQPPVGPLRWRKPQPLPESYSYSTSGGIPFDATKFGPVCPQANYSKTVSEHIPKHTYDEDCLRLNIWTPVPKLDHPRQKWPVMVWFHGGWFQVGDPSQEESMNPTELLSTGKLQAVFIAVGYRLNAFGFLAGSALLEESNGEACGNYGLWDQRLAMDWVHQNVEAFGGDPENIVLSGRSAGAYSVLAQTLHDFRAEKPVDHFRRLLMISNAIPTQPKTIEECEPQFDELCEFFNVPASLNGVKKLNFLRSISAKDLCSAVMELKHHTFRPVTDNLFVRDGIFEYYRDGSFAREFKRRNLRLFIGEVRDEDTLYAVTNGPDASVESLQLQISNYYPPSTTTRLIGYYGSPASESKQDWQRLFGQIIADGQVRAPSRYLVSNLLENEVDINNVWRYLIAYRLSFITDKVAPVSFGVSHAMDRPIWNYSIMHNPNAQEKQLMNDWIRDLRAFVHNEEGYEYGTSQADDLKVMTSEGQLEIQKDARWQELLQVMRLFSGQ
ncbi:Alpha/Beta hydrolase protein [Truncatella angustata]|uniref:Carboxylic ester hydrolase n=1 Tax=Truncatella angustata TaxID=152316 RepID=A0A9P8UJE1_9PEZI|nr:Alpha/Beta hydrolase protein [Truncatella angustata]KAH6653227.1 Alpha/Beta hydrolase protein [Truncatella angustata]KAH8198935.1 hypothetical protein TruAng_006896 [Truncatella angustata]